MSGVGLTVSMAWPSVVIQANVIWIVALLLFEIVLTAIRGRTHAGGR